MRIMRKLQTYKIECYIPGSSWNTTIEAREMTVNGGAYQFWKGDYGETNQLVASYPVMFTIVETINNE